MTAMSKPKDLTIDLYPSSTGLPMAISVSPSYGALPEYVCIKVMQAHNQQVDPGKLAVVKLLPNPHLVAGQLSDADLQMVGRWLALNEKAVLDY
jgi:hypothetical protein